MGSSSGGKVPITEAQKAEAQVALQRFDEYKKTGIPLLTQAAERQLGLKIENGKVISTRGTAATGAAVASHQSLSATELAKPTNYGTNLRDFVTKETTKADAASEGDTKIAMQGQTNYLQSLDNLRRLGNQQEANAVTSLQAATEQAAGQAAQKVKLQDAEDEQWRGAAGSAAGLAAYYYDPMRQAQNELIQQNKVPKPAQPLDDFNLNYGKP